jgi:hypothetical protein
MRAESSRSKTKVTGLPSTTEISLGLAGSAAASSAAVEAAAVLASLALSFFLEAAVMMLVTLTSSATYLITFFDLKVIFHDFSKI